MKIKLDTAPLLQTDLPGLKPFKQGKVRDVYDLGDRLLVVATDRLSAFDVVLPTAIPAKGIVLTQMSLFWFDLLADVVPHHVITADVDEYDAELQPFRDQLEGRSMIVTKTEAFSGEVITDDWGTASIGQSAAFADMDERVWQEAPGTWYYTAVCEG